MINAVCLDISGVLCQGHKVIAGALKAVELLQQQHIPLRLLSNSSRISSAELHQDLNTMGFNVTIGQVFTALQAAHDYLRQSQLNPYCLVDSHVADSFADLTSGAPNAVFIADARDGFSYAALNKAFQLCIAGHPLIAIGDNRYFRHGDDLCLDAGPFIKTIE